MRKEAYERIFACIQKTRYGVKIINGISTAITYVTAVLYFSVLFWLVWQESYCYDSRAGSIFYTCKRFSCQIKCTQTL